MKIKQWITRISKAFFTRLVMPSCLLSWLLHHANRAGRNEHFYKIKNKILGKYGTLICYDVQYIEGKKCNSCAGTGLYRKLDYRTDEIFKEGCWNCCASGWYKKPVWNVLAKIQFGKYKFHQPFERLYYKPNITMPIIEGYIEHKKSQWTDIALFILFLIYEKQFLKRYYRDSGNGWFVQWWRLENIPSNIIHILKKGKNAIPFQNRPKLICPKKVELSLDDSELPF